MYTSTDLDKLKQIMAESPEYETALTQLLASFNETIGAITHEIRNPLTLVYSTLQMIESAHPEVYSFRHWNALHDNVSYMVHLLADLSDYNHAPNLRKTLLDTEDFLKKLVLTYAASAVDLPITFTSRISPELPPLQADAVKLKEVLLNLLKNAAEAIPADRPGSIRMEADITGTSDTAPCMLRIQVQDDGCGIPIEHQEDIFQPFVTYKPGGTGLGLPLSRRIIEAHGGCLLLDSSVDKGTVFTVLLPFLSSDGIEEPPTRLRQSNHPDVPRY